MLVAVELISGLVMVQGICLAPADQLIGREIFRLMFQHGPEGHGCEQCGGRIDAENVPSQLGFGTGEQQDGQQYGQSGDEKVRGEELPGAGGDDSGTAAAVRPQQRSGAAGELRGQDPDRVPGNSRPHRPNALPVSGRCGPRGRRRPWW